MRRDFKELETPYSLPCDDGFVTCRRCGLRVPSSEERSWVGWTAFPDAAGDPHALCPGCSRREFGRFAIFLYSGQGVLRAAWSWIPFAAILVGVVAWSGHLGPLADRIGGEQLWPYVFAFLVLLVIYPLLKLVEVGNLYYLRHRVRRWRERTAA